jgi:hypothetical protein
MDWATFWADFSQTHTVTLAQTVLAFVPKFIDSTVKKMIT